MGSGKGEGGGERAERGALYRSSRETVGPASLSGEGERGEGGYVPFIPGDSWASLSEWGGGEGRGGLCIFHPGRQLGQPL